MGDDRATRSCARCGATATCAPGGLPQGWSILTEARRIEYVCPVCVRANIRAIEGKLPEDYWEF